MTHQSGSNVDAPASIKREDGGESERERAGSADSAIATETAVAGEAMALAPGRIAAIIDGLDIEGLPTPLELAAIASSPKSTSTTPRHKKVLARPPGSQLNKPGRAKRTLKTEVHELQKMVDSMQAQVTGASSEIQEITRLVGQLVDKKQRDEAATAAMHEQFAVELKMEQNLTVDDSVPPPPPPPTPTALDMASQPLPMGQQMQCDSQEMGRRPDAANGSESVYPTVAELLMSSSKDTFGDGTHS